MNGLPDRPPMPEVTSMGDVRDVVLATLEATPPVFSDTLPPFDRVRSHHYAHYGAAVRRLAMNPDMSIEGSATMGATGYALNHAQNYYRHRLEPEDYGARMEEQWRTRLGTTTIAPGKPRTYTQDVLSPNGDYVRYRNNMAGELYAFLTTPDDTEVTMGAIKDGICRAIACAIHCDLQPAQGDWEYLTEFYGLLETYMTLPRVRQRMSEDPARYQLEVDQTVSGEAPEFDPDDDIIVYPTKREVRKMKLPLGLLRDVLTWEASGGRYTAFAELPQMQAA